VGWKSSRSSGAGGVDWEEKLGFQAGEEDSKRGLITRESVVPNVVA